MADVNFEKSFCRLGKHVVLLLTNLIYCPWRQKKNYTVHGTKPETFKNVYIDYGIPVWNEGEIDISPEYLYEQSAGDISKTG